MITFEFIASSLINILGCDEVWHLGLCQDCSNASEDNPHKKYYLFLNHLVAVANYIKTFHPNITIIIWDDMLRSIPLEILNSRCNLIYCINFNLCL